MNIKFPSRGTSQIKEHTCIMLRKDWGLIISRHFWLPMATGQLTQWKCNANAWNSYNFVQALCSSVGKWKLQHWTNHFSVFQRIPNTEVIKQGKVNYKMKKLRFLFQCLSLPNHYLCLSKHPLQWFHHTQLNYHFHLHRFWSQIHPLKRILHFLCCKLWSTFRHFAHKLKNVHMVMWWNTHHNNKL